VGYTKNTFGFLPVNSATNTFAWCIPIRISAAHFDEICGVEAVAEYTFFFAVSFSSGYGPCGCTCTVRFGGLRLPLTGVWLDPRLDLAALTSSAVWPTRGTNEAKIETAMNYSDRIVRDIHIVGREPVFKGMRVTLRTVLASLAEGATTAEILADFPTLSEEDVRAAIAFAAMSAQEDLPLPELPIKR